MATKRKMKRDERTKYVFRVRVGVSLSGETYFVIKPTLAEAEQRALTLAKRDGYRSVRGVDTIERLGIAF